MVPFWAVRAASNRFFLLVANDFSTFSIGLSRRDLDDDAYGALFPSGKCARRLRPYGEKQRSPERKIVYKHILKNALGPIVTLFGLQISSILAGTIVIENVFSIPGIGRLLLLAVQRRDLPVVQGVVLWIATMTVLINIVTDFVHMLLDPRVSL